MARISTPITSDLIDSRCMVETLRSASSSNFVAYVLIGGIFIIEEITKSGEHRHVALRMNEDASDKKVANDDVVEFGIKYSGDRVVIYLRNKHCVCVEIECDDRYRRFTYKTVSTNIFSVKNAKPLKIGQKIKAPNLGTRKTIYATATGEFDTTLSATKSLTSNINLRKAAGEYVLLNDGTLKRGNETISLNARDFVLYHHEFSHYPTVGKAGASAYTTALGVNTGIFQKFGAGIKFGESYARYYRSHFNESNTPKCGWVGRGSAEASYSSSVLYNIDKRCMQDTAAEHHGDSFSGILYIDNGGVVRFYNGVSKAQGVANIMTRESGDFVQLFNSASVPSCFMEQGVSAVKFGSSKFSTALFFTSKS